MSTFRTTPLNLTACCLHNIQLEFASNIIINQANNTYFGFVTGWIISWIVIVGALINNMKVNDLLSIKNSQFHCLTSLCRRTRRFQRLQTCSPLHCSQNIAHIRNMQQILHWMLELSRSGLWSTSLLEEGNNRTTHVTCGGGLTSCSQRGGFRVHWEQLDVCILLILQPDRVRYGMCWQTSNK